MKAWNKIPLPVLVTVPGLLIAFGLVALKPKIKPKLDEQEKTAHLSVNVYAVRSETVTLSVSTQGTVTPKREIDLVAQVSGQVQSVERVFGDGGFFEKDQLLIKIEDRDYQAAYLAVKARKADAEQKLAEERGRARQAQREWRDLGNGDANSLFLRLPQVAAAEARVASTEADLAQAQLNLERTEIRVPFNGRIRETYVELGQYVSKGTRLASVYDTAVAEIRLPLSDRQIALVDLPLGYAAVNPDDAPRVKISGVIGGERYVWNGRITRTAASIDTRSRMIYAVAEVANPFIPVNENNEQFYPLIVGLFVEAEIEGKALKRVITLPVGAVFDRNNIYVLNDEKIVEKKVVTVMHRDDEFVWLRADLSEEKLIVLNKHALLTPGVMVSPILDDTMKSVVATSVATIALDVNSVGTDVAEGE